MTINKPNGVESILVNGQNQIKFDFDQSKAIMSRVDDALQFDFGDGNILRIADFYKVYNKDNKPTFIIEDREITCDEFFTAMGAEDMIPYLGNSSNNQQHGRSYEYSDLELLDGLDRLDGKDLGFNDSNYEPEITGGIGEGGELDEDPLIIPEPEPEPEPEPITPYNGKLSLNAENTYEGNDISISITVDNPPLSECKITMRMEYDNMSKDYVITIPANETAVNISIDNPNIDDVFIDPSSIKFSVISVNGGDYDNITVENSETTVNVSDTIDDIHFTINANDVDENADYIPVTITSDDPYTEGIITVKCDVNGEEYTANLTYANNQWTGTFNIPVRNDNLFIDNNDSFTISINNAEHSGLIYENPIYPNAITVNVVDDSDEVHFNIASQSVDENEEYIKYEITSDDASTTGVIYVTVNVNNVDYPVTLHYEEGWTGTLLVPIRNDDVFAQENDIYTAEITYAKHSGFGEYENPSYGNVVTYVKDDVDEVHFHIESESKDENADFLEFNITSDDPKTDGSIIAIVSVNDVETIVELHYENNQWIGKLEVPVRKDNVFVDSNDTYNASIIEAFRYDENNNGMKYEKAVYDDTVAYVTDDTDTVNFSINAENTDENSDSIHYVITSDDPETDGMIIANVKYGDIEYSVELHYENNQWIGEFTSAIRIDDKYINGTDTFTAEITDAVHVIDGKEYYYENLNLPQSVTVKVTDDNDPVYFNISSSVENDNVVFTITSDDPKTDGDLSVTVDINGTEYVVEMTYENGWTGIVEVPVRVEDIFVNDTEYYKATITNAQHDNLVYEKPVYGETTQEVEVLTDAIKLTVDESFVETGTHRDDDTGSDVAGANLGWFTIGTSDIVEKTYELAFDNEDTDLQALYSKNTYDIHLIEENNVIYGRITTLSEREIDIFEISVDENGHITLELTGNGTVKHPNIHNSDESLSILNNVKVILTETNADNETRTEIKHIDLAFEDDAPYLDVRGTNYQEPVYILNPNMPHNLEDCGPAMDFTQGTAGTKFQNNLDGLQYWAAAGVELSAAIVQFDETGKNYVGFIDNPPKDALEGRTHYLEYSGHNNNANKPWNWGLNVQGKTKWEHGKEISYDIVEHQGQGVVFDLGGKLAYGVNIEFGAVYDMSTSVMQNDLIAPESAVVLFFRNGEFIGQETAGDLSSGSTQRYFGAAVVGGFDKVIVTVNDNDSFDPHPRNTYQHVSDNEFTIRSIDFDTMSNDIPVYAVEGKLDINMGSDGAKGNEHDVEFMPGQFDNFTAIINGEEHDIHMEYSAGNMYVKATDDDGNVLFVAAVGSDGSWEVRQYANFEVKGNTEDGKSMLPLYFKTGQDADGDYSTVSVPFQTNYVEDVHNSADVSVHIQSTVDNIISYNLTDGFESVPVTIKIDTNEEYLKDGTIVNIIINSGDNEITHTLTYDGQQFTSNDGFDFNYDNGVITWDETHIPNEGQLLKVNAEQKWIDEGTEEMISFRASDTAQPELIDHYPLDNNMTIGTEGNDVLNYHPSDILVDGNDGLDILLNNYSDSVMYSNKIQNVEVELNGNEVANIKNASDLPKYGITVENNRLELNENSWQHDIDNTYNYVGTETAGNLSMTLSEDMVQQSDALVFILENGLN